MENTMQMIFKVAFGLSASLLLAAGGAWYVQQQGAASNKVMSAGTGAGTNAWTEAASIGGAASNVTPRLRTPEETRNRLFKEGSLAGTEPSGDWCVGPDQMLKPCEGLRTRFEYYILGLGEVTIDEVRALIEDEARRAHGDKPTVEIMAIFDKYWKVRTHEYRNNFVQTDRSTWLPVFEEQKTVRRQIMGEPWALAFFADDEASFKAYYAQLDSGAAPPAKSGEPVPQMEPGKDPAAVRAERVARYGEEAAARLDAVDKQWDEWDRRLAAARSEWERIQAQANLSEVQKQDEMAAYVQSHFQGKEQVRVRALLKLR
jgi:lipase chaperone LimK